MGPFGGGGLIDGGGLIGGGDRLDEEVVPAEAAVAITTLRVEDPEGRPPPRRAVSVAGDQRLRPLADDVAPEPDPRASRELEPEAARLGDGVGHGAAEAGGFEDDEERFGASGEGGQPPESVGDGPGSVGLREAPTREIEQEQVHRATG